MKCIDMIAGLSACRGFSLQQVRQPAVDRSSLRLGAGLEMEFKKAF